MYSKDNISGGRDTKKPGELTREFTADTRLGAAIAKASPEAQQKLRDHQAYCDAAYENRLEWQEETKPARVEKERTRLLDRYMNDPAPRPNTSEARQNDMKIIAEQSEKHVTQRDQHQLNSFKSVSKSVAYQILKEDRQQAPQHSADVHDQEHGR